MPGRLVVEGKARSRMANLIDTLGAAVPSARDGRRPVGSRGLLMVGGPERVGGKDVLDVGKDQLLVLLLVLQAKLQEGDQTIVDRAVALGQQRQQMIVHIGAVAVNLLDGGAREKAPARTAVALADGLIIGVEEVAEVRMKGAIAGL